MPSYYLISEFEPHWHDEDLADTDDHEDHDEDPMTADAEEDSWVELEK